jgi:hypothetical protein
MLPACAWKVAVRAVCWELARPSSVAISSGKMDATVGADTADNAAINEGHRLLFLQSKLGRFHQSSGPYLLYVAFHLHPLRLVKELG